MSSRAPIVFKTATEDWEFESIHRLNHKTFAEEIPQHKASASERLVDKFHPENTYPYLPVWAQTGGHARGAGQSSLFARS